MLHGNQTSYKDEILVEYGQDVSWKSFFFVCARKVCSCRLA